MPNPSALEGDLKPQARQVLAMLRSAGERGVSNGEFIRAYINRFGGRLHEIREAGWGIETTREGQGRSRYFLRTEPAGVGAGMPSTSHDASAHSGGLDPARSKDSDPVTAVGSGGNENSGGGALFSLSGENAASEGQGSMYDPWSEAA